MLRASLLGLISSMRLDGRKDIQSVKSGQFCIQSLKPTPLTHHRGIIKDVIRTHAYKNKHIHIHIANTIICIFLISCLSVPKPTL